MSKGCIDALNCEGCRESCYRDPHYLPMVVTDYDLRIRQLPEWMCEVCEDGYRAMKYDQKKKCCIAFQGDGVGCILPREHRPGSCLVYPYWLYDGDEILIHLGCPSALSLARVLANGCRKSLKELEDVKKVFAADEELREFCKKDSRRFRCRLIVGRL